jgi:PAS domain S-box-containing protein
MTDIVAFRKLQKRARDYLDKNPASRKAFLKNTSERDLDLDVYKIELELQNADLRESEFEREKILQKYLNLYNLGPIAYFTLNEACLITDVNDAGAALFNLEKDALLNKCFSRYVAPDSQLIFSNYKSFAFSEMATQSCEVKLLCRQGSLFYAELEGRVIFNELTLQKEFYLFVLNISDRKKLELSSLENQHRIAFTDKNNSMNELASTIAHELNTPLSVIFNYIQGCIRRIENGNVKLDEITDALKQAAKQSMRASEVILRLKNFKHNGLLKRELVCIDEMIREVLVLINYEISDFKVEISYRFCEFPSIKIDKTHIQQVIFNLARNAIEAMRDNNTPNPHLIIETNQIRKNEIQIKVMDNGPGVDEDCLVKLFDPHFTTKAYGVGLGLSVSQSIIRAHGGEINAENNSLGGACFSFSLIND